MLTAIPNLLLTLTQPLSETEMIQQEGLKVAHKEHKHEGHWQYVIPCAPTPTGVQHTPLYLLPSTSTPLLSVAPKPTRPCSAPVFRLLPSIRYRSRGPVPQPVRHYVAAHTCTHLTYLYILGVQPTCISITVVDVHYTTAFVRGTHSNVCESVQKILTATSPDNKNQELTIVAVFIYVSHVCNSRAKSSK